MPINVSNGPMTFQSASNKFILAPQDSFDDNVNALKAIYEYEPLSKADMEAAINGGMNHFKLSDYTRTPEDQRRCAELSAKAQDAIARDIVNRKTAAHEADQRRPGSGDRITSIFRYEATDEARTFNQQVLEVVNSGDPNRLDRLRFDELRRVNEEMGVRSAADLARVFAVDDETLVNNFAMYNRYAQILGEMETLKDSKALSEEEHEYLLPFRTLGVQMLGVLGSRADMIANPYYAILDADRLNEKGPVYTSISSKMDDMSENGVNFGDRQSGGQHALGNFFLSMNTYTRNVGPAAVDCLEALDPTMKGAVYGAENPRNALEFNHPVVVHTTDNRALVLTSHLKLGSTPPTVEQYTKQLSDRATKADRFMFTGSKEFTAMRRKMDELRKAQADKTVSNTRVQELANQLAQAAEAYFEHKRQQGKVDIRKGFEDDTLLHKGKNQREQDRLDIAAEYLKYARAQDDTLLKEIAVQMEAAQKEARNAPRQNAPKEPAPNAVQPADSNQKDVDFEFTEEEKAMNKRISRNQSFLNSGEYALQSANGIVHRTAPMTEITHKKGNDPQQAKTTKVPLMKQQDFDALCILASGSGNVQYKSNKVKVNVLKEDGTPLLDANGKPVQTGGYVKLENPEKTFKDMITAIIDGTEQKQLPRELRGQAQGTTSHVFHTLEGRNFAHLGRLLADGMMQNNKMMQEQRGFTYAFSICAKLNEKALEIMKNYPELGKEVEKVLPPEQLQISKAAKALNDMHQDGLLAQNTLLSRFRLPKEQQNFTGIESDVAKVWHMYGAEGNFVGKTLTLETLDPANYPQQVQNITTALAKDPHMKSFIDDLKGKSMEDQIKSITTGKEMRALFNETLTANQQQLRQQNQVEFQLQVNQNAVQQQPQQPQQQGPA